MSYVVSTGNELTAKLRDSLEHWTDPTRKAQNPGIVLLFSGQGADIAGLGKQLLATCGTFRQSLEECDHIAQSCGYPSFLPVVRDPDSVARPTPVQVQLAIVSLELSLARLLQGWGLKPAVVCGHSLGEYAALCFAGAITTAAMIFLVGHRAQLVLEGCSAKTHGMLAVRAPAMSVEKTISRLGLGGTEIACHNSPTDTVVGGPAQEIEVLEASLRADGVKCLRLKAPYAFHTAQMDCIIQPLTVAVRRIPFATPMIPVASTLLGRVVIKAGDFPPGYFASQCRQPVLWTAALEDAAMAGLIKEKTLWIDCGPGALCLPMVAAMPGLRASSEQLFPCLKRGTADWRNLAGLLAATYKSGVDVDWTPYHRDHRAELGLAPLPTYAFDLRSYWLSPKAGAVGLSGRSHGSHTRVDAPLLLKPQPQPVTSLVLRSAVLQRVEKDEVDGRVVSVDITFSSNLHGSTPLRVMAEGHMVDGYCLVPTSVYTEIALAAAFYVRQRIEGRALAQDGLAFHVANLLISRPLVVQKDVPGATQVIRTTARSVEGNAILVEISSDNSGASKISPVLHASCSVQVLPSASVDGRRVAAPTLLRQRAEILQAFENGAASLLLGPSIYRLFRSIVTYDEKYFGIQQIVVHNDRPEALATFRFRNHDADNLCIFSPYRNDSIAHLAGFVLNVMFPASADKAYISSGWESLWLLEPLLPGDEYLAHFDVTKLIRGAADCRVSVMTQNNTVVAVCEGLRFTEVDRAALKLLLSNAGRSSVPHFAPPPVAPSIETPAFNTPETLVHAQSGFKATSNADTRPTHVRRDSYRSLAPSQTIKSTTMMRLTSPAISDTLGRDSKVFNGGATKSTIIDLVLSIISSETGYNGLAWEDDTRFQELGVDSMISMSIIQQVQSMTGHALPSTVFHQYPTVSALRNYFHASGMLDDESKAQRPPEHEEGFSTATPRAYTPLSFSRSTKKSFPLSVSSQVSRYMIPSLSQHLESSVAHSESLFASFRSLLCFEMGVTEEELDEDVSLQELGLDSLMTIGVVGRLQDTLGWEIPSTFFVENNTLSMVREALDACLGDNPAAEPTHPRGPSAIEPSQWPTSHLNAPPLSPSLIGTTALHKSGDYLQESMVGDAHLSHFGSCGTLLSGVAKADSRPLFLVPDGAGSGLAYIFVANALKERSIKSEALTPVLYSLDSPFVGCPEEYTRHGVSVPQIAAIYLREVRRIQSRGPYRLGGWSIGGIHAFEMALQLKAMGEDVELLCLIDSPCPGVVAPCAADIIFEGIGLSLDSVPNQLRQHVSASLASLQMYHPSSRREGGGDGPLAKTCLALWAGQPVKQEMPELQSLTALNFSQRAALWFLHQRKDFGPCGWDKLTGIEVETFVIPNATHFTITKGVAVSFHKF